MIYPASPSEPPSEPPSDISPSRARPDPAQFWAGGAATAVVAALIALIGILICRWTLGIPILAPAGDGAWGNAHTGAYVLAAACVALAATGLLYLLVLVTPQPFTFFRWIMVLATLAAVVYPFSTAAPLSQKVATAVVDLVLGIAITSLLTAVAARAVRRPGPPVQAGPPIQPGPPVQPGWPGQPGRSAGYIPDERGNGSARPDSRPQDPGPQQWR